MSEPSSRRMGPLEEVSGKAISVALSMWGRDARYAWVALRLGARISLGSHAARPSAYGYDPGTEREGKATAIRAAIEELASGGAPAALPDVPLPWVQAARRGYRDNFDDDEVNWHEPGDYCVGISCLRYLDTCLCLKRCATSNGHRFYWTTLISY